MKKTLAFVLAATMLVLLCACGGSGNTDTTDPAKIKGEVIDAGEVKALLPEGWMNVPATDVFNDNAAKTNELKFYKGAKSDQDQFSCPYVQIDYYGENHTSMDVKDLYDNVKDVEDVVAGSYTFTGYTGEMVEGYTNAILWLKDNPDIMQVTLNLTSTKNGVKSIELTDADLIAILSSIEY